MEKALGSSDSVDWEYTEDVIEQSKIKRIRALKLFQLNTDKSLKIEKFIPEKGTKICLYLVMK